LHPLLGVVIYSVLFFCGKTYWGFCLLMDYLLEVSYLIFIFGLSLKPNIHVIVGWIHHKLVPFFVLLERSLQSLALLLLPAKIDQCFLILNPELLRFFSFGLGALLKKSDGLILIDDSLIHLEYKVFRLFLAFLNLSNIQIEFIISKVITWRGIICAFLLVF
jgi:hypothetical protein